MFYVDESNNLLANDATTRSQLIVVKQHSYINNSIFFISVVDEIIRIHKLSMDHHHASLTLLHDVSVGDRFRMRTPIMAARCCDEVYVIGGIHGCGFRFDPKTWISFNLVTKSTDVIEVMDDAPPFSFSGSRYTKVLTNDLWVHATGSIARGMTGSAFSGEIWIVDLKSKPLKWKKSDFRVPEMDVNGSHFHKFRPLRYMMNLGILLIP
uniref:Uncharacterized protein n=1 Tax=Parascaris univalens TaxID=6257 RepID=A0A915A7K0_PARUN